jgi:hypothetical protein
LSADWRQLARQARFDVSAEDRVIVELDSGTRQTIDLRAERDGTAIKARSVIATARTLADAADDDSPWRYAWARNRLSDLVAFTIDNRGRLIGEAWIPTAGLTPEELKLYLRELARVCDWHEFRLTGQDLY